MGVRSKALTSRQQLFEQVAMPHSRSLLRMALRLAADRSAAEDLVQQTLLLGWQGFDGFRADTDARAWLFRILLNAFYAQGRKMRTTPVIIPMALSEDASPIRSRSSSALDVVEIHQAFEALNVDYRTVLYLNVVEGFTCREVAAMLSVPIGTVMSRLSRARQAFRAWFTPGGSKLMESAMEACARESR
jgi:RNA polymerase sigma-70 factor (ECF subfamily)